MLSKMTQTKQTAIVNVYEWKQMYTLNVKSFTGASLEGLEMVVLCRSQADYQHGYDVVIGKLADDNVGETVSFVLQGIMRKEDAVERLKFEKINNQIAFCSDKALKTLSFKECYIVGN